MRILSIHPIKGRNRYSHYPVIEMDLDLERYDGMDCTQLPGFVDRLLEKVPALAEHHCSLGFQGGFKQRLLEGTYLGHIVEHLALELQAMVGMSVVYGRTRRLRGSAYRVVFEYDCLEVGLQAAVFAVQGVGRLAAGEDWDCTFACSKLEELAERFAMGPSTRAILEAARSRGIPVIFLEDGSFFQLGYGKQGRRIRATVTEHTSCNAVELSRDKKLTKQFLQNVRLPVPEGRVVESFSELRDAWLDLGEIVVKPVDGHQGKGVTVGVADENELWHAFRHARQYSEQILVEKRLSGHHLRVLVVGGKAGAAAERFPPAVTGDGMHSIVELVEAINRDKRRGKGHERELTRIALDELAQAELRQQGLGTQDVPPAGVVVRLGQSANLSRGGTAADVTDRVHPRILEDCCRAAEQIGLDVAGVDVIAPRLDAPLQETGGAIIEVNAAPGIRMHCCPSSGKRRDVGGAIVDHLMGPSWQNIPVVAVTGTNGKTTTCRILARMFAQKGMRVGAATTDGIQIGEQWLERGDCSGPDSARALLLDRRIEAAVLETARGGILRQGLGYDTCTVGVVLNVRDDHLGQDEVFSLEELASVKELIVESVERICGWAVLNAEDPYTAAMAKRAACRVILFAQHANGPLLQEHVHRGGRAVYFQDGKLVESEGGRTVELLPVQQIPLLWQGRAKFQMQNVAAAAAAARAAGLPLSVVRLTLANFGSRPEDNPGRLSIWQGPESVRVILDYGHNTDGFRALVETVRSSCRGALWGVVGVPGDRSNESIRQAGWVAASGFDVLLIKEDRDPRGRRPGEVASVLLAGAQEHVHRIPVQVILDEVDALQHAMDRCRSGDWIVVFYERLERLEDLLRRRGFMPLPYPFEEIREKELPLLRRT